MSVGFDTAYSQSDTIPQWIKVVAGFWAENKITDQEFIEALEFLIESEIIKVDDPKIQELKKENKQLRLQIKSFENKQLNEIINESTKNDNEEMYVLTDKTEYGLGDTIKVSGHYPVKPPIRSINGTMIPQDQSFFIQIYNIETDISAIEFRCATLPLIYSSELDDPLAFYLGAPKGKIEKCADSTGNISYNFTVTGAEYTIGTHVAKILYPEVISKPFTIK